MENEIWKDIPEYEGLYQASNFGNIKSLKGKRGSIDDRILKPGKDNKGYLYVILRKNNKSKKYFVHYLILLSFVGKRKEGEVTRHLDGNPINNRFENIVNGTKRENQKDRIRHNKMGGMFKTGHKNTIGENNAMAKFNEKIVRIIKWLLKDGYVPQREIAEIFGVHFSTISAIKTNRNWSNT